MNIAIKKISIILFGLLLITSCGKKAESPSQVQSEVQSQKKLDGIDIKSLIDKALPDIDATYTAPDPLMIKKAFEPCKLEGEDGDMKGSCPIYADGSYLVDAAMNPKHDTKVDITTSGARTMVNYIQLESENGNHIYSALNEQDYKQVTVECDDERVKMFAGSAWEFKKVSVKNKKDFLIAVRREISAQSGWGWLRIYLNGTDAKFACEQLGNEESINSLAATDILRPELQPNASSVAGDSDNPQTINRNQINNTSKIAEARQPQMTLEEIAQRIGAERIVECALEASAALVTLEGRTGDAKMVRLVTQVTADAYILIMKAFQPSAEIEAYANSYTATHRNRSVEEKLLSIAECSNDPLAGPVIKAVASTR